MDSIILTNPEISELMLLLIETDKSQIMTNCKWKLIYRASEDGLNEKIAKLKYENKRNIISLIETINGNVLGGYTSSGWRSGDLVWNSDHNAFLFGLRSNKGYDASLSNIRKEKAHKAIYSCDYCYLVLAFDIDSYSSDIDLQIYVDNNGDVWNNEPTSYEPFPTQSHLLGGDPKCKAQEIEIFELIHWVIVPWL